MRVEQVQCTVAGVWVEGEGTAGTVYSGWSVGGYLQRHEQVVVKHVEGMGKWLWRWCACRLGGRKGLDEYDIGVQGGQEV